MLKITVEEMDILKDLQSIEDESVAIRKSLAQVEDEIESRRKKLQDAEKEAASLEASIGVLRKEYREYETEFESRNTRLEKSEEYIKTVSSNSEYQVLLREMDDNRKRNAELEGQMLELLDQIETDEKDLNGKKSELEKISEAVATEVAEIESGSIDDRKSLDSILEKRDSVAEKLNPKIYKRFSAIIKKTGGKGLVPVTNAICGGCYMNVPPQMFIEIQRGEDLFFCPQCHRMLYYKEEE